MDGFKEIAVVWSAETLRAVRSARTLVLLGLYGMFSLVVLLVATVVANQVRASIQGMEALEQMPTDVAYIFKITLWFLPVYVALMGFDQISGEVGSRSIRYLTVRARVSSVLLGKFLVQSSLLVGLVFVIDVGLFIYARFAHPNFAFTAMLLSLLKVWLATLVFALAYVAITTFCSSLFRTSGVSLVFNFVLIMSFLLMELIGWYSENKSFLVYIRYLAPSYYSGNLLSPVPSEFGLSALAYACFTAVFLGGAYAVLRARDL
ncbi:ABC transporter permease [Hyalangium versicolor]|uniref:ABC transporter permease n=1 Tax=Hyalangium versicolor TaxID=2861190 RepID=UPI001CC933B7|nr:ABC transporter permease [Hyalangium versicolor]